MIAERDAVDKGFKDFMRNPIQQTAGAFQRLGDANAERKARGQYDQLTPDAQAKFKDEAGNVLSRENYANKVGDERRLARDNKRLGAMNAAVGNPTPAAQNPPAQNPPAPQGGGGQNPAPAPAPQGHIPGLGMFGGGQQPAQNPPAPPAQQGGGQNPPAQNPPAQNPPAPPAQQGGAPAPAAGGNQMQNAANQMAFGADAAALARGKGGDQQSWMKNRSFGGKVADVLSMGLTANMGQTGYGARRQANQQSKDQTDRYNLANQNMAMRAAGMQPQQLKFASAERIHNSIEHILLRKQIGR